MAIAATIASRLCESTHMFSALRYPQYKRFWFGNLFSIGAQQMLFLAQGWLVYDLTGSALYLGYAGLVTAIPAILLNLAGGVLADRLDQRKVIMITQATTAALIFTLATLTALGWVEVWHVLVIAFFSGALQAFNNPARQSIFPQLLDRKDLMNAISLNSMIWQGTRIIAPAIGGVLIAFVDTATVFYVCGFGALGMVIAAAGLKVEHQPRPRQEGVFTDLRIGLSFIRDNFLFAFLIGMTFFNSFFGQSGLTLMPVFAEDVLDVGPSGLGFLFSAYGTGTFLGVLIASNLGNFEHKGLLIVLGATAFGGFLLLFAICPYYPLALLPLFLAGICNQAYIISVQSILQLRVPDELRGRVMGVYGMTYNMGPLGALVAGGIADAVSAQAAVAVGAIAIMAFALGVALTRSEVRSLQVAAATPASAGH
ncbi:MAG: MFS transporter [Dehalococcoidia bacterium]|nr:MFS transporter [Dehalococcoidia bacterium]